MKEKETEKLEMTMADNTDPGDSSYTQITLPTGYLDASGVLHREAIIKEMTGIEEDILTSRKMNYLKKMSKVLENCIESIGEMKKSEIKDWSKVIGSLTSSDRMAVLIGIRMLSLGEEFSFKVKCTSCEKESNQTVSLREFKIEGCPNPYERKWEGILPRSKKSYECRIMLGADEEITDMDPFTHLLMSHVVSIGGKKPSLDDIKKLSTMDRTHLRLEIRSKEGKIDNEIDIECPYCHEEFKSELTIGSASFFFP